MATRKKKNNFIVLNNVRSAYNVGSIIRLCDALNFDLVLQGITPHPPQKHDKRLPYVQDKTYKLLCKTATESINNVAITYLEKEVDVLNYLKSITFYALEEGIKESESVFDFKKTRSPFALIAGNEVAGVSKYFLSQCEKCLYIPQFGKNKSLNVGFALAVASYTLLNKASF